MGKEHDNINLTGYELSKDWHDFAFENTDIVCPNHGCLYFWIVDKWNRTGQSEKFGLPTDNAMQAMGIKNYKTYKKTLADLIEWGFIRMVQESRNQYTANIIALVKNTKALTKALRKAVGENAECFGKIVHSTVHGTVQSIVQSTVSVYKQETSKPETLNNSDSKESVPGPGTSSQTSEQPEKKRKKCSAQRKKAQQDRTPHWAELKGAWIDYYKTKFNIEPSFEGKEAAALKSIADRLQKHSASHPKSEGKEWDAEYSCRVFSFFLSKAFLDPWRQQNFMLHILSSHFDAIIQNNEQPTSKTGKPATGANVDLQGSLGRLAEMYQGTAPS